MAQSISGPFLVKPLTTGPSPVAQSFNSATSQPQVNIVSYSILQALVVTTLLEFFPSDMAVSIPNKTSISTTMNHVSVKYATDLCILPSA